MLSPLPVRVGTTRLALAIRLPYSSPFFLAALPSCVCVIGGGGAPSPKEPRGMGTPPFCSKRAIRSRRAEFAAAELPGEVFGEGLVEEGVAEEGEGEDEAARCWRAAMRSLRLTGGPRVDDLQVKVVLVRICYFLRHLKIRVRYAHS